MNIFMTDPYSSTDCSTKQASNLFPKVPRSGLFQQDLTRGSGCHVDQSGDDTCQFLPRGMPRRLKFVGDQLVIDTCHMCHVAVRPTPVGPSPGGVGTHPPTHHPPPTTTYPGHTPTTHHLPGCFRKFQKSFRKVLEVLERFRKFQKVLEGFRRFQKVLESFGTNSHVTTRHVSKFELRNTSLFEV